MNFPAIRPCIFRASPSFSTISSADGHSQYMLVILIDFIWNTLGYWIKKAWLSKYQTRRSKSRARRHSHLVDGAFTSISPHDVDVTPDKILRRCSFMSCQFAKSTDYYRCCPCTFLLSHKSVNVICRPIFAKLVKLAHLALYTCTEIEFVVNLLISQTHLHYYMRLLLNMHCSQRHLIIYSRKLWLKSIAGRILVPKITYSQL